MTLVAVCSAQVVASAQCDPLKLAASDGSELDSFGRSVAVSGTTIIVGSPNDDHNKQDSGSAYLFDLNTGQQLDQLDPSPGQRGAWFGSAVGISGTTAIVGAPYHNPFNLPDPDDCFPGADDCRTGAAYLFDVTSGQQIAMLLPSDLEPHDDDDPDPGPTLFGCSVAISGNIAVVGAQRSSPLNVGAVYVYDVTSGQQLAILAPTNGPVASFGCPVAISGTTALILVTSGCPPNNTGLYFMGGATLSPVFVGDGLACTGGLFRFFPGTVGGTGTFLKTNVVASAPAGMIQPGDTRHFQAWTRDVLCGPPPAPCPSPCGMNSNLSNGYTVVFTP